MSTSGRDEGRQILRAARHGDAQARERLIERYRNYLSLLAGMQLDHKLKLKESKSDLVQQTVFEAWRDFDQFQGQSEEEFAGWLRRILARNVADLVRRYRKTQARNVDLELRVDEELSKSSAALGQKFDVGSSPSQHAAREEAAVILADAMAELPEDYRQVVVLRNIEGKTFPEIAQEMHRSLNSVKNLWFRAFDRLRELLEQLR